MRQVQKTTFDSFSDEDLLLRSRMGDPIPLDVLLARKNAKRHALCHMASPKMKAFFDDWDINEIFFHAFYDAVSTFEFSKGCTFNTFLLRCLTFVMANRVDKKFAKSSVIVTDSFDDSLDVKNDSSLTLADVVSLEGTLDNPKDYLNYQDSIMEITNLPKGINPLAIDIMRYRLKGFTVLEAARSLGISHKRAAYIFARYAKWVKKLLGIEKPKRKKKEEEKTPIPEPELVTDDD